MASEKIIRKLEKKKANINDILKASRRMPQVILPKDAAMIVAYTGACPGWNVIDSGTGSCFLSMFIANIVKPGKVVSYERNAEFAKNAKKNAERAGFTNIRIINRDIFDAKLRGKYDLATLDMKDAEKIIPEISRVLASGRFVAVYSPHIEQVKKVRNALEQTGFSCISTIENIVREWKVTENYTHPVPSGVVHTGFLTFARKPY